MEIRPGGSEGDNIVKTRLQTGDMTDVFCYNSGSLLQALAPEQTLVDLSRRGLHGQRHRHLQGGVASGDAVYGVPVGNAMGGGILYNRAVYDELGLEVPTTWDDFMANNKAILDAGGLAPVIQRTAPRPPGPRSCSCSRDNYNVLRGRTRLRPGVHREQGQLRRHPGRAGRVRAPAGGERGRVPQQGLRVGHLRRGLAKLVAGKGAHYPMLTFAVTEIAANDPEAVDDIGFFAIPGDDADERGLTTWLLGRASTCAKSTERPGRGQEVPGLHRQHRGLRRADRGGRRRPVRTSSTAAPFPTTCRRRCQDCRPTSTAGAPPRRWSSCRRSRACPGADHRRGRIGNPFRRRWRGPLRRGREEAGPAARASPAGNPTPHARCARLTVAGSGRAGRRGATTT